MKFHSFWNFYNTVTDPDTESGWVEGFDPYGLLMNAAANEIENHENSLPVPPPDYEIDNIFAPGEFRLERDRREEE